MSEHFLIRKTTLFFAFFYVFFAFSQSVGDYRSVTGGSLASPLAWTNFSTWQVYNGTSWTAATSYPGETGSSNTYSVTIQKDSYVATVGSPTYFFGTLNIYGVLSLNNSGGQDFSVLFSTTNTINIYGPVPQETNSTTIGNGTLYWGGKGELKLPSGAVIHIYNYNTTTNKNGLQAATCNNNNNLYIGTQRFAVCSGGNASFTFSQINIGGGTIEALPTVSPSAVCQGGIVSLSSSYSGTIGSTPTYSWTSTTPSGTANAVVNPTAQNPGAQNPLTIPGTYSFTLQVSTSYSGTVYTNAKTVYVTVNPKPAINNMAATSCSKENFTVTPQNVTNGTVPPGTTYTWAAPTVTGGISGGSAGSGSSITGTFVNATGLPQTATYTVTPTSGAGCTGNPFTVVVTVNSVNLTGSANITSIGGTTQLTGSPAGGTFFSTNTAVATVNSSGTVTGLGTGTSVIRYTAPNGCSETLTVNVGSICYNAPSSPGTGGVESKVGITTLKRAAGSSNWPMERKGAYLVLEGKNGGFVLPRMTSAQISAIPAVNLVEGMLIYNTSEQCLYVYDGVSWKCFKTQTCP